RVVAGSASRPELAGVHVLVTGGAAGGESRAEIGGGVARRAGGDGVPAAEREPGPVVVEGDLRPALGGMADAAAGVAHPVRECLQRNGKRCRLRGELPTGGRPGCRCSPRRERRHRHERDSHGVNPRKAPRWKSTWQSSQAVGTPRYLRARTPAATATSRWQPLHSTEACFPCNSNVVNGGRCWNE